MDTIYERVKAVVVDTLNLVSESDIKEDTLFVEDMNADLLALVALIMRLEYEFSTPDNSIEIPEGEGGQMKTIADVVTWLKEHGVKDQEGGSNWIKFWPFHASPILLRYPHQGTASIESWIF